MISCWSWIFILFWFLACQTDQLLSWLVIKSRFLSCFCFLEWPLSHLGCMKKVLHAVHMCKNGISPSYVYSTNFWTLFRGHRSRLAINPHIFKLFFSDKKQPLVLDIDFVSILGSTSQKQEYISLYSLDVFGHVMVLFDIWKWLISKYIKWQSKHCYWHNWIFLSDIEVKAKQLWKKENKVTTCCDILAGVTTCWVGH